MRLDDSYRLLELDARASDEEIKRAWRDLTKVWHPDRFPNDPAMRRRAEEKVKAINEAYGTIQEHRGGERPAEPAETAASRKGRLLRSYRSWSLGLAMAGLFLLVRRPTPGGLLIAAVLFGVAAVLLVKMSRVQ